MPSTPRKPQDHKKKSSGKKYGSAWSKKSALTDLELPSGELCQVKRPGIQGLMKAGVLHSLDTLTSIVENETIPRAQGKPSPNDVKAVMNDPEKFQAMMNQVDKIVMYVVTQPTVVSHLRPVLDDDGKPKTGGNGEPEMEEIPAEEREPGVIYVDYIDAMDKMYIMNFAVGGSANLQQFRQETTALVGSISAGEADEDEAK